MTLLAFLLWSGTLFLVSMLIGTLSDGLRKMMKETESTLIRDAMTDSLTSTANRRAFDLELEKRLVDKTQQEGSLALILVDIDFFKHFNDRYGHQTGDQVLIQVAKVLERVTRSTDVLARYGGEEFAVILPNISTKDALQISERMRALIEQHRFDHHGLVHRLTISVGTAFAVDGDSPRSFCERADAALYSSKENGRNGVHYHDGSTCISHGVGFKSAVVMQTESESLSSGGNSFNDPTHRTSYPIGVSSKNCDDVFLRKQSIRRWHYLDCLNRPMMAYPFSRRIRPI